MDLARVAPAMRGVVDEAHLVGLRHKRPFRHVPQEASGVVGNFMGMAAGARRRGPAFSRPVQPRTPNGRRHGYRVARRQYRHNG